MPWRECSPCILRPPWYEDEGADPIQPAPDQTASALDTAVLPLGRNHMEDNPPIAMFKLGENEHMARLFNEGHVFMRPLQDFKSIESSRPRLDPDEGLGYSVALKGTTLNMQHEGEWRTIGPLTGPIRAGDRNLERVNLYCLHTPRRNDCGKLLGLDRLGFGESYVLFWDADEFLRRLTQAITKAGLQSRYALVEYVAKHSYSGPMGAFRKFSHYSNQKELRVVAMPGQEVRCRYIWSIFLILR